jgi:hypothetical protein
MKFAMEIVECDDAIRLNKLILVTGKINGK